MPSNTKSMTYQGNDAMSGFQFRVAFNCNMPTATSAAAAMSEVSSKVTAASLAAVSRGIKVTSISFSALPASG